MPDGGKLTIETRGVTLDKVYCSQHTGAVPGAYLMLSVSDTGTGMDAELQARVFEPFFRSRIKPFSVETSPSAGQLLTTLCG